MRTIAHRHYCQHKAAHATAGHAAAELRKNQNARHRLGLYRCPCGRYHVAHIERRPLRAKRVIRVHELED